MRSLGSLCPLFWILFSAHSNAQDTVRIADFRIDPVQVVRGNEKGNFKLELSLKYTGERAIDVLRGNFSASNVYLEMPAAFRQARLRTRGFIGPASGYVRLDSGSRLTEIIAFRDEFGDIVPKKHNVKIAWEVTTLQFIANEWQKRELGAIEQRIVIDAANGSVESQMESSIWLKRKPHDVPGAFLATLFADLKSKDQQRGGTPGTQLFSMGRVSANR